MRWLLFVVAIGCGSPRAAGDDAPPDDAATSDSSNDAPTDDAPVSNCPADTWCVEPSPVAATLLKAVWAVNANDVFAVGDDGTILRRRNATWTQETSNTTQHLRGVWAASSTQIWAVGDAGTILRSDGTSWTAVTGFTADFKSVWGSGPNDVWISAFGRVVHWDGNDFTNTNLAGTLLSVHGTGPSDVWATGEDARVRHFTTAWSSAINAGAGNSYFAVHALAANDVHVAGFEETRQFDGGGWNSRPAVGCVFQGFHSTSPTNLWGVGGTNVARWNGSTWTVETPAGATADFYGVSGAGTHVWAVGSDSLILYRN